MRIRSLFMRRFIRGTRPQAFGADERGAVAVEFAFLAPPFFALIFAILETSITFLAGQILDSAVHDASRVVRTGQAHTASTAWTLPEFRAALCERLYGLFDCAEVKIKVSTVSLFQDAEFSTPVEEDCAAGADPDVCEWTIVESYAAGVGTNVVMVQAYYKWPTLINVPGLGAGTLSDGTRVLSGIRVFKNEPF
jgi:Flp pilus assembly protein TadG